MSKQSMLGRFYAQGCCSDPKTEGYVTVSVASSSAQELQLLDLEDVKYQELSEQYGNGEEAGLEGTTNRPPRSLVMIFAAAFVMGFGVAIGAVGTWFLWGWQRSSFRDVCLSAPSVAESLLQLSDWQNLALAIYCENIRTSVLIESCIVFALAFGVGCLLLRLSFGQAYFTSWSDSQQLGELERLYSVRSYGGALILHVWRARVTLTLFFELVVLLCFRYYLDLYLDVLSMQIFWDNGDTWFMFFNLSGIVAGLLWTCADTCFTLAKEKDIMPTPHILLTGFLMPIGGLHVLYLTCYSLHLGEKHKFLFLSTLAESVLESSVSAFVQTYSVVFSVLHESEKITLYYSIGMAFVSIGMAFSSLDRVDGGELLIKVPGFCKGYDSRMITVTIFRIAEVTSRSTSLALFQLATRPYGVFYLLAADLTTLLILTTIWQYIVGWYSGKGPFRFAAQQLLYALPCAVCLMAPILEKDCVLTVPPHFYYSLRFAELAAMLYVIGWKEKWSLDIIKDLFARDTTIVITCAASTLLMFILFFVIRFGLVMSVMLEAKEELWFSRAFGDKQIALRNRILARNRRSDEEHKIMKIAVDRIKDVIQVYPDAFSWQIRDLVKDQQLQGDPVAGKSLEVWEDRFLRAKASLAVEKTAKKLDEAVQETLGRQAERKRFKSSSTMALDKIKTRRDILKTGLLVQFQDSARRYVTLFQKTLQRKYNNDNSTQKFLVEHLRPEMPLYQPVKSSDRVRLRSLSDGSLLAFIPQGQDLGLTGEKPKLPFKVGTKGSKSFFEKSHKECAGSPEHIFSVTIAYTHVYRSAKSFTQRVKMESGDSLKVQSLRYHSKQPKDWEDYDWEVISVDGSVDNKYMRDTIDSILKKGGTSAPNDDIKSEVSDVSRRSSGAEVAKGEHSIVFQKLNRTDISLDADSWRSTVILHPAAAEEGWKQPHAVSIPTVVETFPIEPPQIAKVETNSPGSLLVLEQAEYDNADDGAIYSWAADQIFDKHSEIELKASLAEKYRMAVVAGFNARTLFDKKSKDQEASIWSKCNPGDCCLGSREIQGILHSNRDTHMNLLRNLSDCLRGEKRAKYVCSPDYDYKHDFRLKLRGDGAIVVFLEYDDEAYLASSGLQADDELVELEIVDEGDPEKVLQIYRTKKEMANELSLEKGDESFEKSAVMHFRCAEKASMDSEVVRMAVEQASSIAPILPSWSEILVKQESEMQLLRYGNFFEMKCSLVTSLLTNGWDMYYQDFCEPALKLHQFLRALHKEDLVQEKKEETAKAILVAQLDVLTASWSSVPKVVKEQRPDVIKKLFCTGSELEAMSDAVKIVYDRWLPNLSDASDEVTRKRSKELARSIRMPEALKRFFMRVLPETDNETPHANSIAWLRKSLGTKKDTQVKKIDDIIKDFSQKHKQAEAYWRIQMSEAAKQVESAESSLKEINESEDLKVVLVDDKKTLQKIKETLDPASLKLKEALELATTTGEVKVPIGFQLLREGHIEDMFGSNEQARSFVGDKQLHNELMNLFLDDRSDLRLIFSTNDFKDKQDSAIRARKDLETIIPTVKHAAEAFPELSREFEVITETMHKAEGRMREEVNKRKLKVQKKEAEVSLKEAKHRLDFANARTANAVEQLADVKRQKEVLQGRFAEVANREKKLKIDVEQLDEKNQKLEADVTNLENDKKEVQSQRDELDRKNRQLQTNVENLSTKFLNKQQELDTKTKELDDKNKQLDDKNQKLQTDLDQLESKRAGIEQEKANLASENSKLEKEKEDWQKTKREQEEVLKKLQEHLESKTSGDQDAAETSLLGSIRSLWRK